MNLQAIKFCRFKGEKNEWSIEGRPDKNDNYQWLDFQNINLIAGKNASGKSKTIDVIRHIADLFADEVKLNQLSMSGYGTGSYELKFNDNGNCIYYLLSFKQGKVLQERLLVNEHEKLNRFEKKLWYEGIKQYLEFQTDDDILAISKRDKKQHSFFEKLYTWGKNLSHYRFGKDLGKYHLLKSISFMEDDDDDIDLKDNRQVTAIFVKGKQKFNTAFTKAIIDDMKTIDYDISSIDATAIKYFPITAFGLNVQENDLKSVTDQREMSQGMFRALSLLIQINYSLLTKIPSCILIDDIGEGLDYDRSKILIELIIKKVENTDVQILMSTNDRFVMNKIPLKYWSVIQRKGNKSIFYNYENSQETFDDFEYTGLNNFDFLTSEFYITGFKTISNQ